jgi:NADH dehydrogenase/NADH:ubiquinone oxidoreductase subunit G
MNAFTITIDQRTVEVAPGRTVLQAARQIGLEIPTLCHLEKCGPLNSCQVCLVKIAANGHSRLPPRLRRAWSLKAKRRKSTRRAAPRWN